MKLPCLYTSLRSPLHHAKTMLLLVACLITSTPCSGKDKAADRKREELPSSFIRLHAPRDGNPALQVAIATYRQPKTGIEVDLVGAVHVADAAYFDALNTLFQTYDAVLFEMIGGRDGLTKQDLTGNSSSSVSKFQNMIRSVLDLTFQLEAVDYTRDNFFHADMSAEDYAREQRKHNEGMLNLLLRANEEHEKIRQSKPGGIPSPNIAQLLRIALSPSRSDELKLLFARELIVTEGIIEGLERDGETVIVSGRNRLAMAKLEEVAAAGKTRVAIFYGAAHLPGMERLLLEEGGFKRTGHRWITAWDIKIESRKTKRSAPSHQKRSETIPASPSSS